MNFQNYIYLNTAIAMDFYIAVQQQLVQKMGATIPGSNLPSGLHLFQSQDLHLCKTRRG